MLEPRYDHKTVEEKIYSIWEKSGYFNPDRLPPIGADSRRPYAEQHRKSRRQSTSSPRKSAFSIIMPPPNANAPLHIGHAVGITLQDIMLRFARMRGKKVLGLPGADHAGFETQVVFDKKLEKEGRSRFQMERDKLWQEMWGFTQTNKKVMENQTRKLGASCDWSREKFTLDPDIVQEVQKTFIKLHEDGLVYRDMRVINWCTKHKTALSDLEVKYVEREDPLYYIKYGPLTLATVRPETKFGDTALAINPKDKRYQKYIGKVIEAQGLLGPLKFKVIADEAIDQTFGTGVVKVTPAHDAMDFEIWQRHKEEISGPKIIIDENGRLTGDVGEFKGLKVAEARLKVAEAMESHGILEKVDQHYIHQVATCYKCGTTLEPMPRPQWFIKMQPLAKRAIEVVQKGKIKFYPERIKKVYFHWLKNIRDWNISRQIVWGIRIPAWFCLGCNEVKINPTIKSHWFLVRHGETQWNKEGKTQGWKSEPLNEVGVGQVETAAEELRNKNIDLIISSDLLRCKQTAEIISKATGAKIVFEKDLRERHMGITEGMHRKDRDELYGHLLYDYHKKPPGGETWQELEKRVWDIFVRHKKKHDHKNVVIVSHGGTIRMLINKLKNIPPHKIMDRPPQKNAEVTQLDILNPCKNCGGDLYEQDPDVFDTWFSSGQWPFLTLGYPKGKDYKEFYPTDVMETAYDILFFWVARMIMLGLYRTDKIPFKNVYIHGLVRDKDRQKMSKSKGNVVDPLGVAEIYGTDAVRMALVVGNTAGNDVVISEEKIRGYRNFATKVWNVARFILMNKPLRQAQGKPKEKSAKISFSAEDKKNLAELKKIKSQVTKHIEKFEFHLAAEKLYHYIWHEFADKIIEATKGHLKSENAADRAGAYQKLETILTECLKMLHPFMPFVTEEIYQKFHSTSANASADKPGKMLMIEKW